LEAGAYTSFNKGTQRGMGTWNTGIVNQLRIQGSAPYWRVALQKEVNGHYFSLGHFGFSADVVPDLISPVTYDNYVDLGVDVNYQYLADPKHIYEFKGSYINEQQKLSGTYIGDVNGQGANKLKQSQNFLGLNASYTYDQTYSFSLGFNRIFGTTDVTLNGYSTTGRPNSEYFTAELNYIPFGKEASLRASLMNLRFALQYTGYTQLNGAVHDDGTGANRSASNNNTLFLNGWLSF
jgi:hypothetical protein